MKIIKNSNETQMISQYEAEQKFERYLNNEANGYIFVVKYKGKMVSFSGEYYKFAWKSLGDVKRALSLKYGKELSNALVESGLIEVTKVYI